MTPKSFATTSVTIGEHAFQKSCRQCNDSLRQDKLPKKVRLNPLKEAAKARGRKAQSERLKPLPTLLLEIWIRVFLCQNMCVVSVDGSLSVKNGLSSSSSSPGQQTGECVTTYQSLVPTPQPFGRKPWLIERYICGVRDINSPNGTSDYQLANSPTLR